MPPVCPVESHAGCYKELHENCKDATGLPGGVSRWLLQRVSRRILKMPPACPVESHVSCYKEFKENSKDATGLPGGVSR